MGARKPKIGESKKEEAGKEKSKDKKPEKKRKMIEGVSGVVRLLEVDLDGTKRVRSAILGVKGVGKSLANGILTASGLDSEAFLGSLNEEQIHKLEDAIRNPSKYGIPFHMLNRRFDPTTGEHRHLVSSELSFAVRGDIDLMKKTRSYKGIRHELGLPVRGQKTRSSFRTGMIVGVSKAKVRPGEAPKAPAGAPGAPQPAKGGAPGAPQPAKGGAPGAPQPAKGGAPEAKASVPAKTEKKEEKK
jgi:small subunit ribosomal protein S13